MRRLRLLLLAPALAACGQGVSGDDAGGAALPEPRQVIVALDLSGSQSAQRRAQARAALEGAIDDLGYGDRIVLIQVHQRAAAEDEAVRWTETVPVPDQGRRPTSLDRERLDAVKQAARSVARSIFEAESAGRFPTTDLFATLHVAAEYVRDAGRRPTHLVFLSDMLQSAHGVEMSRGVPSADWVRAQAAGGLLPRLDDTCVTVVGADATTANGIAVREFWKAYLEASGAALPEANYRLIATGDAPTGCG
jgi:hypothetical protein